MSADSTDKITNIVLRRTLLLFLRFVTSYPLPSTHPASPARSTETVWCDLELCRSSGFDDECGTRFAEHVCSNEYQAVSKTASYLNIRRPADLLLTSPTQLLRQASSQRSDLLHAFFSLFEEDGVAKRSAGISDYISLSEVAGVNCTREEVSAMRICDNHARMCVVITESGKRVRTLAHES